MFHFLCYVNIFQTVFPRVADAWLANFESQLQGCVQQAGQPEVLGIGDVLPLGGPQELQHGAVREVQELHQGAVREVQDLHDGSVCAEQQLHDGVVRVVQEEPHETQQESFVNFNSSEELPQEVKLNVLARNLWTDSV